MSDASKPSRPRLVKSGREARSYYEEGKRKYGPFRIKLEVQMSPLAVVSDTLEFYVYQETGEAAIAAAGMLLRQWYCMRRIPYDGYPKPVGHGYALPISDEEYRMTWQQAEHNGREMEKAGDQKDPVAFHVRPRNTSTIITPWS